MNNPKTMDFEAIHIFRDHSGNDIGPSGEGVTSSGAEVKKGAMNFQDLAFRSLKIFVHIVLGGRKKGFVMA